MAPQTDTLKLDDADDELDELVLDIRKEEKEEKPPIALSKLIPIFLTIFVVTTGIAVGIAAIIYYAGSEAGWRSLSDWVVILLMTFGGFAITASGLAGFWGGQRKIPIRIVSPSDASVIGRGVIICGYSIERCLDNEIELTIYNTKKEPILEEILPLDDQGLFFKGLDKDLVLSEKTANIFVEAWMVSIKSKKLKLLMKEEKLEELNVYKKGLKIGSRYLFPRIYKDFDDKSKVLFDPKRREKGTIEKVSASSGETINIFFPQKGSDDNVIPFSFEALAKMRNNALNFDLKRSRRYLYSLLLFIMGVLYFVVYPVISIFL